MNYVTFFEDLKNSLSKDEKYWIAVFFLKVIYADDIVHVKEIPFMSDVCDFLDQDNMLIESAKKDAKSSPLDKVPPILLGTNHTERLLKCLLEIILSDDDFDDREYFEIGEIAAVLGLDEHEFENFVSQAKTSY